MSCTQRAWAHLVLYVLLCIVSRCYKWCKSANAMRTEHMQEQWQMLSHGNQYSIRLVSCDVCSMVNFGRESRLMCPLGHVKQFSAVYIHELRSTSGHKRPNFQFHKCQYKGIYQMQLKLRNPMVPFFMGRLQHVPISI